MNNKTVTGIVIIALGILVVLITNVFFPVCTDKIELMNGKTIFMKCHWTAVTELMIGILIVFNGILFIVFKKHETHIALNIMLFLLGLAVVLVPTKIIGMCETPTMACRIGTEPALIVAGAITMAVGIGNIFFHSIRIKSEKLYKEGSVVT